MKKVFLKIYYDLLNLIMNLIMYFDNESNDSFVEEKGLLIIWNLVVYDIIHY